VAPLAPTAQNDETTLSASGTNQMAPNDTAPDDADAIFDDE
jgi:hypothetical protein